MANEKPENVRVTNSNDSAKTNGTPLHLGVIGAAIPDGLADVAGFVIHLCDDIAGLPRELDGILLTAPLAEASAQLLAIRQIPRLGPLPVWLSAGADPLADGVWSTEVDLKGSLNEMRLRMQALFQRERSDDVSALLHYLWCRPQQRIVPERDWQAAAMYRYPLLEALSGSVEASFLLLNRLIASRFIIAEELIDRVPSCPQCSSAHLIFHENCPACQSIDIIQSQAVHCFSCGHVGLEEYFRRTGELVCPNCGANLRHIGSDYDRPIENMACNTCGELFVEPDSSMSCAACARVARSDQVQLRSMSIWGLSQEGRQACRHGHAQQVSNLLDALNLILPEYFQFSLLWLMNYARRYVDSPYSLMLIDITNLKEVVDKEGVGIALAQMDAFIEHLAALVRTTDFIMRSDETRLWLAMPRTNEIGLKAFIGKLNDWVSKQEASTQTVLHIGWQSFCSERPEKFKDTEELFAYLTNMAQQAVATNKPAAKEDAS